MHLDGVHVHHHTQQLCLLLPLASTSALLSCGGVVLPLRVYQDLAWGVGSGSPSPWGNCLLVAFYLGLQ